MSESAGEKSFAPSQKRIDDAAKNGDVLRSKELATAVGMLVGVIWLKFAGPWVFDGMSNALRVGFTWDRATLENFQAGPILYSLMMMTMPPVLLLGVAVMLFSLVSQLGFGTGRWLPGNLAPKGQRINPLSGLKRMFGPNGLIELGKGLVKVGLLGTMAWFWASGRVAGLLHLGQANLHAQLTYGWDALISLLFTLSFGLVLIALADFPIQLIRRMGRLKMTLQEVRDEGKEQEGSPEKKGAIKRRQREIAMGAMSSQMRKADFVVTNPTHFSVALSYNPEEAAAPVVVAKGRGEKALAMRELAAELSLPVLEYPALARSLYYTTRERQMIREELYVAVAAVLGFVMSLKRGHAVTRPQVDVPVLLRFDTEGRLDPAATN
ncbi:flagellar biosynthesis protein FlhB [Novosphingobium sp. JCM 18896]|uniref:EscU/YscU/HrcU family type III secretion system export apparatus switch protein n=1 Tax=Novosphingobium sp. JCM 18896 TaxID=2989731 RepID=UPI002222C548|nr:flagellar type III secretion system protein FlhB [Novosphingobium sp. JCM 18896]MCW1428863.1 flagellar type III secretion system protein FlhB [Novosphingobium sp. JCM 18896]